MSPLAGRHHRAAHHDQRRRRAAGRIPRSAGTTAACGCKAASAQNPERRLQRRASASIYAHLFGSGRFADFADLAIRLRRPAHLERHLSQALRHLAARPAGQRSVHRGRSKAAAASPSPVISSRACAPPTTTGRSRSRCRWSNTPISRCTNGWAASSAWTSNSVALVARHREPTTSA